MTKTQIDAQKLPAAPEHFTESGKDFWRDVVSGYELDSHSLKVLEAAVDAYDRMVQARRVILQGGIVYEDRFGQPRPSPAISIERDSRLAMLRAIRELGLDVPVPEGRPPRHGGQRW